MQKYGGKPYTDYKKMIVEENLDAVHICLPYYLHTVVSRYALENGVNVLCEKHMPLTCADAEKVLAAAENSGKNITRLAIGDRVRTQSPVVIQ